MGKKISRDSLMGRDAPELDPGERIEAAFAPDRATYWRDNAFLAGVGAIGIMGMMIVLQNPHVVIGTLGAGAAVVARAAWLASETLGHRWELTDRRLIGPGGRMVMLLEVETARRLMGDVQVVTRGGDKHLIKHMADAPGVVAAILRARDARRRLMATAEDR